MSLHTLMEKYLPNQKAAANGHQRRLEDRDFQAHARVTMAAAIREGWASRPEKKRAVGLTSAGVTINEEIAAAPRSDAATKDDAIRNRTNHEPAAPGTVRSAPSAAQTQAD